MPLLGTLGSNAVRSISSPSGGAAGATLYSFTDATFTPGGQTGSLGPSLSQIRSGLSGTGVNVWKNDTDFFNNNNGIQLWTVPQTATYRIDAYGAEGGLDTSQGNGGRGARIRGDFDLVAGTILNIVVGQRGLNHGGNGAGGGGGSFIYTGAIGGSGLLIAAGGGGGSGEENTANGRDANSGNASNNSVGGSNTGNGGLGGSRATAGAGWGSNGSGSQSGYDGQRWRGGSSGGTQSNGAGGFGGGGSNEPSDGGGGGGGYTGGNGNSSGSRSDWGGSGAGSYNSGSNQVNTGGANAADGRVVITKL